MRSSGFGVRSKHDQDPLDNIAWDELFVQRLLADTRGVEPFTPQQLLRVLELVRALVTGIALIANEPRR